MAQESWFSTKVLAPVQMPNSQTTFWPSPPSLSVVITGDDPIVAKREKEREKAKKRKLNKIKSEEEKARLEMPPLRARKIRLYPSREQEKTLRQWMGTARHTYNQAKVWYEKHPDKRDRMTMRLHLLNSENVENWQKEVPYQIRDGALGELLQAFKVNFKKMREGKIKKFTVKFRSKKDSSQSILIPKDNFSRKYDGVFYEKSMGSLPIKSSVPIPRREDIGGDCRLQYLRTGKWFLIVPMAVKEKENKARQIGEEKIIALDPGVRTFMTGYAPTDEGQGYAFEFGKGDIGRLIRLAKVSDELQAKIASAGKKRKRKKRRLRQAMLRNNERIRHTRDELHWKIASFMVQNFTAILLPVFQTQNMVKRTNRKIRSRTARQMITWSHYQFQQRLISKAEEWDVRVILCDESYTSRTCGACGLLRPKFSSKTFKCPHCHSVLDRDVNAARNILLRALVDP